MCKAVEDKKLALHFADDQVIFAEDESDLRYMLRKLHEEYNNWTVNPSSNI